jgi:hypothetical protein
MNLKKHMNLLTVGTLLFVTTISAQAGRPRPPSESPERYIDALVSAAHLVVYSEDGAADSTVMENPVPEVRNILLMGAKAIPLLIAHLKDTRITAAKFGRSQAQGVPVGYVCLDILSNIVMSKRILIDDCADDGLGACVRDGYYFRPDAYSRKNGLIVPKSEVFRAQVRWKRAYRNGKIKYRQS